MDVADVVSIYNVRGLWCWLLWFEILDRLWVCSNFRMIMRICWIRFEMEWFMDLFFGKKSCYCVVRFLEKCFRRKRLRIRVCGRPNFFSPFLVIWVCYF